MPRYKVNANRPFVVLKAPYGRKAANEIFEGKKSDLEGLVPLFLSRMPEPKPEPEVASEAKDNVVQNHVPTTKPTTRVMPKGVQVAPSKKEAAPVVASEVAPVAEVEVTSAPSSPGAGVVVPAETPVAAVETTTAAEVVVPVEAPAAPEEPAAAPAPAPKAPAAKETSSPAKASKKKEGA